MTRLTQAIREKICKSAITAAFKERESEFKAREHSLGMECYAAVLPEVERIAAAALPARWTRQDACLRFNANGWHANLSIKQAVPVPYSNGCSRLGDLSAELAARVQAHMQEEQKLREERWKAESELSGFLDQFKTLKQMREAWPEGEAFYGEFDVERKAAGVPAVRVAEINKLLNLGEAA